VYTKFPFKIEKQFRLPGYDYSQNGYYFVTICIHDRLELLGSVGTDHCVCSSPFGQSCNRLWMDIPNKFKNIILDDFIIMPDHIHGIIIIKNDYQEQTQWSVPTKFGQVGLVGQIIRWFKTISTNDYINGIKNDNWPKFNKQIWQPRFHDHVIRNEKEYFAIKQYIKDNPKNAIL
jgi:REP element-mobilizing transposase RayT